MRSTASFSSTRDAAERKALLRTFFAAWPDEATRGVIAGLAHDVAVQAGTKSPPPANLHLTLAFIGDVAPARLAALREIGAAVARAATPFTLVLDRIDGFRDAGIAWLGTDAAPPELERLVAHLRDALAAAGFPVDARAFRVHLTLARRCRQRLRATTLAAVVWRIDRLTLTASDLGSDGSRYRDLAAWPLGAGRPRFSAS